MTDDTRNCDDVAEYLETTYPDLKDGVLVIHTKNNGEISEASSGKAKERKTRPFMANQQESLIPKKERVQPYCRRQPL